MSAAGSASRVSRSAFTLIELLIVIAIIAALLSILVPALKESIEQTRQVACLSNLRHINTGFLMRLEDQGGVLPDPPGHTSPAPDFNAEISEAFPSFVYQHLPAPDVRICPSLWQRYPGQFMSASMVYYPYNQAWDSGFTVWPSAGKKLTQIRRPYKYPLFYDGSLRQIAPMPAGVVPVEKSPWVMVFPFGAGFWHGRAPAALTETAGLYTPEGQVCNAVFADGHAEPSLRETMEAQGFSWYCAD